MEDSSIRIPVYKPYLHGNEKTYVNDCLDSSWISSKGSYIQRFEAAFSSFIGCKHAIALANGTVALHAALLALGIGVGDEVIVPTLTYVASANAVTYTGAQVVFADSEPKYWQIDPKDIERRISPRTKAIMVVHLYGSPCNMDPIMKLAKKHNLFVIEDCAESFGAYYRRKHTGIFGDIAIFSFYGNKTITTGEGGMVVTNDYSLLERVERIRGQGLAKYREYWHDIVGYNYRMTNICAAIGLAQIEQSKQILKIKNDLFLRYKKLLAKAPIRFQLFQPGTISSHWMISFLVEKAEDRDPLRNYLLSKGIETRPVFYPLHTMPIYSEKYVRLQIAEDIAARGITLPSYPDISEEEIQSIVRAIFEYFPIKKPAKASRRSRGSKS